MTLEVLARVGRRGCTVSVVRRDNSPHLYLRWWDSDARGGRGGYAWKSLGHSNATRADAAAKRQSARLRMRRSGKGAGLDDAADIPARLEAVATELSAIAELIRRSRRP